MRAACQERGSQGKIVWSIRLAEERGMPSVRTVGRIIGVAGTGRQAESDALQAALLHHLMSGGCETEGVRYRLGNPGPGAPRKIRSRMKQAEEAEEVSIEVSIPHITP
jgi:hypothetical protein